MFVELYDVKTKSILHVETVRFLKFIKKNYFKIFNTLTSICWNVWDFDM